MKKLLIVAAVMIASVIVITPAHAGFFTLWQPDLLASNELVDYPAGNGILEAKIATPDGGVYYTGQLAMSTVTSRYIGIGLADVDLTGYDSFKLAFFNTDQLDWNVGLFVHTPSGTYSTANVLLSSYESSGLSLDLTGIVDLADADEVGFTITTANDRLIFPGSTTYQREVYNMVVNPVPEPITMVLFGSGLVGLAARRRKV